MNKPLTYADLVEQHKTRDLKAELEEAMAEVNANHRARVTLVEIRSDSPDAEPCVIVHPSTTP